MMNRAIDQISFFSMTHMSLHKIRRKTLSIVLATFIFTFLHTAIHNDVKHIHDTHCGVYVLEQLYFGVDIVDLEPLFTFFFPFIFVAFQRHLYSVEEYTAFSIRAPPLYRSFS